MAYGRKARKVWTARQQRQLERHNGTWNIQLADEKYVEGYVTKGVLHVARGFLWMGGHSDVKCNVKWAGDVGNEALKSFGMVARYNEMLIQVCVRERLDGC